MRNIAASFDEAGVSDMVRFGIVAFQDNTSHSQEDQPKPFGTRVIHPLTPGSNAFGQAVDKMVAYPIGGDWPEDGLSGISTALDMLEETKSGKYLNTKTVGETPITVVSGMTNKTPLIWPN